MQNLTERPDDAQFTFEDHNQDADAGDGSIGVHNVIALLQTGESVESVVANCFPTLTRAQVYECLAYYEDHRGEIDVLMSRQMQTEA